MASGPDASAGPSTGDGDGPIGVGDARPKHVHVITATGERVDHGEVYFRFDDSAFAVCSEQAFPSDSTTHYEKSSLRRVEVTQHHAACFVTTATTERADTLDDLRGFRDDVLVASVPGRVLVSLYYRLSPPVAATLERHPGARTTAFVRRVVDACASLERRRRSSDSRIRRRAIAGLVTALYVFGLACAIAGHACIRLSEGAGPETISAPATDEDRTSG